ncbi:MAG: hypothetical protein ACP5R1_07125 [Athalassotoga sp.]
MASAAARGPDIEWGTCRSDDFVKVDRLKSQEVNGTYSSPVFRI